MVSLGHCHHSKQLFSWHCHFTIFEKSEFNSQSFCVCHRTDFYRFAKLRFVTHSITLEYNFGCGCNLLCCCNVCTKSSENRSYSRKKCFTQINFSPFKTILNKGHFGIGFSPFTSSLNMISIAFQNLRLVQS